MEIIDTNDHKDVVDDPSMKKYTNLLYFDVRQGRMNTSMIKRDHVQACFEHDLEIFRITKNFRHTLRWLVAKGIIPDNKVCINCNNKMRLANQMIKAKDGVVYKCTRLECKDLKVNIRDKTFFQGSQLTLMEFLRIMFYYFPRGFNALQTFLNLKEYKYMNSQY